MTYALSAELWPDKTASSNTLANVELILVGFAVGNRLCNEM